MFDSVLVTPVGIMFMQYVVIKYAKIFAYALNIFVIDFINDTRIRCSNLFYFIFTS